MTFEILKISLRSIAANKVRTVLTMLGIIIGISAVIALLSLGQGAQKSIEEQIQGLGSNTITIFPSAGNAFSSRSGFASFFNNYLDSDIVNILENQVTFKDVTNISPELARTFELNYRSKSESASVVGVKAVYFDVRTLEPLSGKFFTVNEDANSRKIVVLGYDIYKKLFGESDALDKSIKIDGSFYKVIGVAQEKNRELDGQVYIPLNTAGNELVGTKNYSSIIIQVDDEGAIDSVVGKIERELMQFYRITSMEEAKFTVFTSKDILSLTGTITGIFTTLLSSIASISLLVGGIGIMNIMLVSVTERTREIGLRKAVGAKQRAILMQFLMESMVLTLLGGIIGIILGLLMAFAIGSLGGIPVELSLSSIILATSVSTIIGIVFGFYPAYRAAKLNPIDALRYE